MGRHEIVGGQAYGYPAALRRLGEEAPETIYVDGILEALQEPCITITGTRHASETALEAAYRTGAMAAEEGLTVVTGGALGCEAAAARAALEAGGNIVIVSGCGADRNYPAANADIFDAARKGHGAVVSLEPWGETPHRFAFKRRDPAIAALSHSLLLIEAGCPSGVLERTETAIRLGSYVYALPGPFFDQRAAGNNRLIATGRVEPVFSTSDMSRALEEALEYARGQLPGKDPAGLDAVLERAQGSRLADERPTRDSSAPHRDAR